MKRYRILFCDLDDTLIETLSGEAFPKGVWDMRLKIDVFDKIKELKPEYLFIVTNQGGISTGYVDIDYFISKMKFIVAAIKDYTNIPFVGYDYCSSNNPSNWRRKPNSGMLHQILHRYGLENVDLSNCLMIGDASGKEGQYSNTDRRTAERMGIDYLDVIDFLNTEIPNDEMLRKL